MPTNTQESKHVQTQSSNCAVNLQWLITDGQLDHALRSFSNPDKEIIYSLKAQLESSKCEAETLSKENRKLKEENESLSLQIKRLKSYLRSILMVARA